MTISIWRYSHLALAVSSAIFILIATITGIILAFEPISHQVKPYAIDNAENLYLSEAITTLQNEYTEIITLTIDENDFVVASVITKEGKSETFYVNPFNGEKLGNLIKKEPIFEFATNLHRSLFLKSTGRFLVGLFSFFLCLIAISGIILIVKRQGGVKRFFSKIIKEDFEQYYHVILGRYTLIPIIIITLTGVFLSLEKFDLLPSDQLQYKTLTYKPPAKSIPLEDMAIFNSTRLSDLKGLEFPFSEDEEDYFILQLKDKEFYINQYTGQCVSEAKVPFVSKVSSLSMLLHTGQGTIIWAIILLLSCFAILFFMYSGFTMTLRRTKASSKIKNQYNKDEAEYIILVGSETGNTFRFAKLVYQALINQGRPVFIDTLNNYTTYKRVEHLLIFTATYGEGDAPTNADNFEAVLEQVSQERVINYAVVGFGSLMYPAFCKYAIEVDSMLHQHPKFNVSLPVFKINNQSHQAFETWVRQWNESTDHNLSIVVPRPKINKKKLNTFRVIEKTPLNIDQTFKLQLRPQEKLKFQSGDLLAFYPEKDNIERLYSVGKIDNDIILSIKKHNQGVCSSELSTLKHSTMIKAKLKRNIEFHVPSYAKEVVMIANGTGITPFLGVISNNKANVKTHLFWGGRTHESFQLYSDIIDKAFKDKNLNSLHIAYSQENNKAYVQDLLQDNDDLLCHVLQNDGVVMICGSVAMQNNVLEILNSITTLKLKQPLSDFENNEQIKMDCY